MKRQRVLVVDDEPDITDLLKYNLELEGYSVKTLNDGRKAISACQNFQPSLVILDIMMPYQDGVETCRRIRGTKGFENVFIMFLTARSEEYSEVAAFDSGADDYIIKPIRPRALMSRINNLMKATHKKNDNKKVKVDELTIDSGSYTVTLKNKSLEFPKKEFELLFFLAKNPNRIHSREKLLAEVWGSDVQVLSRTVDVHIRKIREKIGNDYIQTIKGVGYKFVKGN